MAERLVLAQGLGLGVKRGEREPGAPPALPLLAEGAPEAEA